MSCQSGECSDCGRPHFPMVLGNKRRKKNDRSDKSNRLKKSAKLNPLDFPEIVRTVLQYLDDPKDLVSAKLVNKTWANQANGFISKIPIAFENFKLRLERCDDEEDEVLQKASCLSDLIAHAVSHPDIVHIFKTFILIDCNPSNYRWAAFFSLFGSHLECLTISTLNENYDHNFPYDYNFGDILKGLPRLTTLHLDVATWTLVRWTEDDTKDLELALPSLKCLKLLPTKTKETGFSVTPYFSLLVASDKSYNIWTVLRNIVKAAPNLKVLSTSDGNLAPEELISEMFTNSSFGHLDTLRLGGLVSADRSEGKVQPSSNFFSILLGNASVPKLKTLKLARPSEGTQDNWTNLFSWISGDLVTLDLGEVSTFGRQVMSSMPPLPLLDKIQFQTRMVNLRSLSLHVTMLPFEVTGAGQLFPALEELTLICQDFSGIKPQLAEVIDDADLNGGGVGIDLENFSQVSKLSILLQNRFDDERSRDIEQPFDLLFQILFKYLQNVVHLELAGPDGMVSCNDLKALLYTCGTCVGTDGVLAAEKIEVLHLKDVEAIYGWEVLGILAGAVDKDIYEQFNREMKKNLKKSKEFSEYQVPDPVERIGPGSGSLKNFKNLRKLVLRIGYTRFDARISSHFVRNTVCLMPKLEYLDLNGFDIDHEVIVGLQSLPGLNHFDYEECAIISKKSTDEDSSDDGSAESANEEPDKMSVSDEDI